MAQFVRMAIRTGHGVGRAWLVRRPRRMLP